MDSTRAFYAEKLGYLYGLIFAYRQEMVEILNDKDLPNNDKLLYCLIYADNLQNFSNAFILHVYVFIYLVN